MRETVVSTPVSSGKVLLANLAYPNLDLMKRRAIYFPLAASSNTPPTDMVGYRQKGHTPFRFVLEISEGEELLGDIILFKDDLRIYFVIAELLYRNSYNY